MKLLKTLVVIEKDSTKRLKVGSDLTVNEAVVVALQYKAKEVLAGTQKEFTELAQKVKKKAKVNSNQQENGTEAEEPQEQEETGQGTEEDNNK